MSRGLTSRLSYANVVATLALFVALGGGAYAAIKLPKNSVGPKQLKTGAVTTQKLRNNAVTAAKVANGTLTGKQINSSTLGTVPNAAHAGIADNAATVGGVSAGGFLHGSGSTQQFRVTAPPGGSTQIGNAPGVGTLSGTCDNPCKDPVMTYTNTSSTNELVEWDAYSGVNFTNLAPGASAPSGALGPSATSGLDGASVTTQQTSNSGSEAYFGAFIQWSSSGANFDGEVFNGF